jgi:hypothetical protein
MRPATAFSPECDMLCKWTSMLRLVSKQIAGEALIRDSSRINGMQQR